jgi:transcriptional regulator with XRE-family HTH domain
MKERIREVREHFGLSMEKFGARIGIGKTSISLLESGKNNPSVQTVALICREFGVNEHWLRTGEGEMFEQTRETVLDRLAAEYSLDKEQVSVIENFLDLSPQERGAFLAYMRKVFGPAAAQQPPRRADVSDDVAAAVVNVQDEVARYNAEQADEAASGGKESSSTG